MKKPIFLVGYMAAGKTTLGRYAASRLGREFIDLDWYIEARYHTTISDIFARDGEERFREIERNMLHEVGEFYDVLIATGGGTPCHYDNMQYMLQQGTVIFLEASVPTICRRVRAARNKRPLLASLTDDQLATRITTMLTERLPYYTQATHTFNADNYESRRALDLATRRLTELDL